MNRSWSTHYLRMFVSVCVFVFAIWGIKPTNLISKAYNQENSLSVMSVVKSDEFPSSQLSTFWTMTNADPANWSLTQRPGYFRVMTQQGDFPNAMQSQNNAKNVIFQPAPDGDFEIITKVDINPTVAHQQAGLFVYQDDYHYYKIVRVYESYSAVASGKEDGGWTNTYVPVPNTMTTTYLRIVRSGIHYSGYYGSDGQNWTLISGYDLNYSNPKIGLIAVNAWHTNTPSIPADFDFFRVNLIPKDYCSLNGVPQFYQGYPSTPTSVLPLDQQPYWYNLPYGAYKDKPSSLTMGTSGCLITSHAMVINFLSSKFGIPFFPGPEDINIWLHSKNAFNFNPVDLGMIFSYDSNKPETEGLQHFESMNGLNISETRYGPKGPANDAILNNQLCKGYPAILHVNNRHFVVATGEAFVNGQFTYLINDPAKGQTTLLDYGNFYDGLRIYTPQIASVDLSAISIEAHSPIHLVVTDPNGKKAGYDPRTGILWDEIPDASYTTDSISDPSSTFSISNTKVLYIPSPIQGDYSLEIIGYDNGPYEVDIHRSIPNGITTGSTIIGEAQPLSVETKTITYSSFLHVYLPLTLR